MIRKKINKRIKKNKYRIALVMAFIVTILIVSLIFFKVSKEKEIAKYDSEIIIFKGNGDQLEAITLKELREIGCEVKNVSTNKGLEKTSIEGVSLEKIIGKLDYNFKDSSVIDVEDDEGNVKKISMSQALEPDRVYLVYKLADTPVYDVNPKYGKIILIDIASDSSSSWIRNVKTLDIR
ncbi:hypothetical protein [Anaerococcus sp. Marseille-P9784]|uniref:hypothetical protein n=1 Tax=Anaerococcus sp. Marseille-P9784 TaxID=2614127 RepID=UPI00124A36C3|nr:hypothetical protein [Anaerococcus sp. Marseille-P9784]